MTKISMIVPVYNAEPYIERCARSLFEQTFNDIEYIFVDDCSPDNSIESLKRIVKEYSERRSMVRIHHNEKKLGVAGAKNVGIKLAKGEFLMFADSDDWLAINGVEEMYKFASKNNLDIAYCDFYGGFNRAQNERAKEPECNDFMNGIKLMLTGKMQGPMWNKIFRRKFILSADEWLIEGANVFEDLGWCIRLFAHKPRIGYTPLCFYYYFINNPNSMMRSKGKSRKELPDVYVNLSAAINTIENLGLTKDLKEELLFAKARARDAFLGTSMKELHRWRRTYPETNVIIMNGLEKKSVRIAKWLLAKGFYLPIMFMILISKHIKR